MSEIFPGTLSYKRVTQSVVRGKDSVYRVRLTKQKCWSNNVHNNSVNFSAVSKKRGN